MRCSSWTPSPATYSASPIAAATGSRYCIGIATEFALWAKRLEGGAYAMPFTESGEARREITAQELGALLSGIDLSQVKRRKRCGHKAAEGP
jgi:IS66 Orf2 like protein